MTASRTTVATSLAAALLLTAGCGGGGGDETSVRAALRIAPAPIGQSDDREALLTPARASFDPASPGGSVEVERSDDGGETWAAVPGASGEQDRRGVVRLLLREVADGDRTRYRVVGSDGDRDVTSPPVTATAQPEVFADDFDDAAVYRRQWAQRYTNLYHGNRLCATPDPDRVAMADGVLTLSVAKIAANGTPSPGDPAVVCDAGVWDNAMIGTALAPEPFVFTHGTVAARMRVQPGKGMHSGFWLQQTAPGGSEIDIAEYYGDGHEAGVQTKIHHGTGADLETSGGTVDLSDVLAEGESPAEDWHVYSVQWTAQGYVFAVDGVETMRTDQPAVSTSGEEIALSLLTSDYSLGQFTQESSTVAVDWVRVWQDPEDTAAQAALAP